MSRSLNNASLIGHLGKHPDVRTDLSGRRIVSFSLATSDSWKDKDTGERKERTHWHRVVIMAPGPAQVAQQALRTGSRVFVRGSIENRSWTDDKGQERHTTEIVVRQNGGELILLDKRSQEDGAAALSEVDTAAILDDEIPY